MATNPVVPGYERSKGHDHFDAISRGEILLSELNCLSCHQASEAIQRRIGTKPAPDLSEVGSRITPSYLLEFLADPQAVKPGTTMPNIFHASEKQSKELAVGFLANFLTSKGDAFDPGPFGGSDYLRNQGEEIYHSVGCVACHGPQDGSTQEPTDVPLPDLSRKTTLPKLQEFLADPLKVRHGGRMPDLQLTEKESLALAVYLLRGQLEAAQSINDVPESNGVAYDYYETGDLESLPNFEELTPTASGVSETITINVPERTRRDRFAMRFKAKIRIEEAGEYRFGIGSDDGSKLFLGGELIIDNDRLGGVNVPPKASSPIRLSKGDHPIELQFFERTGDEGLYIVMSKASEWRGRRGGKPIPAEMLWIEAGEPMMPLDYVAEELDKSQAPMGARMFAAMRCASCHQLDGVNAISPSRPLNRLNLESPIGCLSDNIRRGLPDYQLSDEQRSDLKSALSALDTLGQERSPDAAVRHHMATLNCYACHSRDGIGGPSPDRSELFTMVEEIDLGDEGRIPPHLSGAGAKLKTDAIKAILAGDLHVRGHYMATRMPLFGEANVAAVPALFAKADGRAGDQESPKFDEEQWKIGHQLVGIKGLSCIACHRLAGQKSAGIQGIDLATVYDRINPGWFRDFLLDPARFNEGTRMPGFFPDGKSPFPNLAGGDAVKQIEGIWSYLSLRKSMPLPEGIVPEGMAKMELVPDTRPIVHRTFMKDVGPRTITVGFPEKLSVAFDANVVRMAKVWRGRFFDQSGVESGRSDTFLGPLGDDIIDLPAGPAFAVLNESNESWPTPENLQVRDLGGDFKGYRLDSYGQPTFHYQLDGVTVEETPVPTVRPGGSILQRRFRLRTTSPIEGLSFIAAVGPGDYSTTSAKLEGSNLEVRLIDAVGQVQKDINGTDRLIVPVKFENGEASITVDYIW